MQWRTHKSKVRTLRRDPPIGSLDRLCRLIGYELQDRVETRGKMFIRPAYPGFDINFAFGIGSFKDHYSGESEREVRETGINNLKYYFPEPKYGIDADGDHIRIYVKSATPEQPNEQI